MRILFLTHYFPPEVNAPATRTYDHCRRWVEAGHEVTVLTCNPNCPNGKIFDGHRNRLWPQVEMVDGIRIVRVWTFLAANRGKRRRSLNYASYLVSAFVAGLFQQRPDVLIATSPQFFCGLAGMFLGWLRRIPRVLEVRDIWPASIVAVAAVRSRSMLAALVRLERLMYSMADQIVTVGSGYRDHILDRTDGNAEIAVIPNGVDLEKLDPSTADNSFFDEQRLDGADFVCSYIGTLGMAHGLEVVPEAARILKNEGRRDIHFALIGDGATRGGLEARAAQLQVNDLVSFHGLIPKRDIATAYASSDAVLIHLSDNELFETVIPSKLFEAMAMKCPIILGVRGAAKRIVDEAHAGISFEPEEPRQLADAIKLTSDDRPFRESLAARGRSYVRERFSRDSLATEFLDVLNELTGAAESDDRAPWTQTPVPSNGPLHATEKSPPEPTQVNARSPTAKG